jgi:hypothetical protein
MSRFGEVPAAGSGPRRFKMFSRVCGEIIAVLLLVTMLILKLVFFLCNEKEAVEIDLSDIEEW